MSVRFNLTLSDELNSEIDKVAEESETNKSEILRKALQLYLAAREGTRRGLKLGLVEPTTQKLETEIIGFVIVIAWLCVNTLLSAAEEKKWAMSILSASAGGLIGYLVRK